MSLGDVQPPPSGLSAAPPGWDGEQRGEPGIHGVPRARRWDAVVAAHAPLVNGDTVHFVALADGSLVVDEDQPDEALTPLADALETRLAPPYRAEGVRRDGSLWGVAGRRIALVREPGLDGDEAELVVTDAARTLTVDGLQRVARAPAFVFAARWTESGADANGTASCSQTVPVAGSVWFTRYAVTAAVAHSDSNIEVCPQPWTVRSLDFGSSPLTVTAPW